METINVKEIKTDFVTRISELLKMKKLNSADVSDMTGIPRTTMLRYKNGECSPSIEALIAIAKVLNVSINYLLGMEDADSELTKLKNIEKADVLMHNFSIAEQMDALKYLEFLKMKRDN